MAATQLLTCPPPYGACAARRTKRAKPVLRSRLVTIALALAVAYGMYNGERWLLEDSPASANELTVATCLVDIVFGDDGPPSACSVARTGNDGDPYNE